MNDLYRFVFISLLVAVGITAYLLVIGSTFINRVDKAKNNLSKMPGRSFLLGLVNFLFFGVISLVLILISENAGQVIKVILLLPALLIILTFTGLLSLGLAGQTQTIGKYLLPNHSTFQQALWGSIILCLGCALPIAGWFLLLPYTALASFGAIIISFFQKTSPA